MVKKLKMVMVTLCLLSLVVFACAVAESDSQSVSPRYSYTASITAGLSFSGNSANCSGTVTPSGYDDVSVTVTLYRQNGSSWDYVTSWSGSAEDGSTAGAGGSVTVGSGTYKVTTRGNVGNGKEYPTKSVTRTK